MVCIFNFFVVPSCFTSSPNSLFPPWYFFWRAPSTSQQGACCGRVLPGQGKAPFHLQGKHCCGAWWSEGSALKCAIEWEALLEKCSRYFARRYWVFNTSCIPKLVVMLMVCSTVWQSICGCLQAALLTDGSRQQEGWELPPGLCHAFSF